MNARRLAVMAFVAGSLGPSVPPTRAGDGVENRVRDLSDAPYVHRIDVYDIDNRRVTADSTRPYSPRNTCGRCHDYDVISHGWHFGAFASGSDGSSPPDADDVDDGRRGEPWIWTDARTGTQLPLTYRDWDHAYAFVDLELDPWGVTRQFGARLPGGGVGEAGRPVATDRDAETHPRWKLTGSLEIDCLVCHAAVGTYDFSRRREQIDDQNFAWAPTAAARIGDVKGSVARLKDDADPTSTAVAKRMPSVTYAEGRFESDGKVYFDIVGSPSNESCRQCHSQRWVVEPSGDPSDEASGGVISDGSWVGEDWFHDDDVHLQAGMACTDCHRNGIGHDLVRGFVGQSRHDGVRIETLTCVGCHLGGDGVGGEAVGRDPDGNNSPRFLSSRGGRLGSPRPAHAGLPPIHFERLSCTACHSGPIPGDRAVGVMTSFSHGLGRGEHWTGRELPRMAGPVFASLPDRPNGRHHAAAAPEPDSHGDNDGRVHPMRAMWPAFWGTIPGNDAEDVTGNDAGEVDGVIQPLDPDDVYEVTRRSLRVRRDFQSELVDAPEKFEANMVKALRAIAEAFPDSGRPVYVSSGRVLTLSEDGETLNDQPSNDPAVAMRTWPLAHNVRPAGWSLGIGGCTDCHVDDGAIFASTVTPTGPIRSTGDAILMADLQGVDGNERALWNRLFAGRGKFKYAVGGSLGVLMLVMLAGVVGMAGRRDATRT